MKLNKCAPKHYDAENNTCFSTNQLMEMVAAYNRYMTKNKLNPQRISNVSSLDLIQIKSDKKYLLQELKKRFEQVCGQDEICLTQQAFMNEIVNEYRDDIMEHTFRPNGPDDSVEWLSTKDINSIMNLYHHAYPNFAFCGAVPLDCSELSFCSLFQLDFQKQLDQGKEQLAVIFNLDKYGESGSHWVALYINITNGEIYFCDSNGKPPLQNIRGIIDQFTQFHQKKTGKNPIYKYNTNSYQRDNSECGVYSCNFIIRKLAGESFDDIVNNPLTFPEINSCRNVYFRNAPSQYQPHEKCDPKLN